MNKFIYILVEFGSWMFKKRLTSLTIKRLAIRYKMLMRLKAAWDSLINKRLKQF